MNQPTIEELKIAFEIAKEVGSDIDLQRIRDKKTTWFGKEENDFRFKIDAWLEKRECSICYGTGKVSDGYEYWDCRHCDATGFN